MSSSVDYCFLCHWLGHGAMITSMRRRSIIRFVCTNSVPFGGFTWLFVCTCVKSLNKCRQHQILRHALFIFGFLCLSKSRTKTKVSQCDKIYIANPADCAYAQLCLQSSFTEASDLCQKFAALKEMPNNRSLEATFQCTHFHSTCENGAAAGRMCCWTKQLSGTRFWHELHNPLDLLLALGVFVGSPFNKGNWDLVRQCRFCF